jgi:type II secretion system protein H
LLVRAFTLLELVLVMVIISTVLAMAAPSLQGFFASRQIHDAAAQILAMTKLARSQAVCDGTTFRLNFNASEGTYWLTAQKAGAYERITSEFGQTFTLPKDTVLESESLTDEGADSFIAFTSYGTVTPCTIRLTDRRGNVAQISCKSATESFYVELFEANGEKLP